MALVETVGFTWAVGQLGLLDPLLPGQFHVFAWQPFPATAAVLCLAAHPLQLEDHQALAIEAQSTAYGRTGQGSANFQVHNVSDTVVRGYGVFASSIGL